MYGDTELLVKESHIEARADGAFWPFEIRMDSQYGDPALVSLDGWGMLGQPNRALYRIYVQDLIETSDERVKENIQDLKGNDLLQKIKQVRPVSYVKKEINKKKTGQREIGFLAQNLKEQFPEIVSYDEKSDRYGVKYSRVIPIFMCNHAMVDMLWSRWYLMNLGQRFTVCDAETWKCEDWDDEIRYSPTQTNMNIYGEEVFDIDFINNYTVLDDTRDYDMFYSDKSTNTVVMDGGYQVSNTFSNPEYFYYSGKIVKSGSLFANENIIFDERLNLTGATKGVYYIIFNIAGKVENRKFSLI